MKKQIIIGLFLFVLVLIFGIGSFSCTETTPPEVIKVDTVVKLDSVSISFETDGGSLISSVKIPKGSLLVLPAPPSKGEDLIFESWYTDAALSKVFSKTSPVSEKLTLYAKWISAKPFAEVFKLGRIPNDLSSYHQVLRDVLKIYPTGSVLKAIYVTQNGGNSTKDGTAWDKAYAGNNLKNVLNGITDANRDTIYLVLLGAGLYPVAQEMTMKNYVAIVGGFAREGGWERPSNDTSRLDGGKSSRIFNLSGNSGGSDVAQLYGLMLQNGYSATDGGAIYSELRYPTITNVVFSGNTAAQRGGALYTQSDAAIPFTLRKVEFRDNSATFGGAFYSRVSRAVLNEVKFIHNKAMAQDDAAGGAIYYHASKLDLINVSFFGNTASSINRSAKGGAVYYDSCRSTLAHVSFSGNTASSENNVAEGGAVFYNNSSSSLMDVIFNENKASGLVVSLGGAVRNSNAYLELQDVSFNKNEGGGGGGMYSDNSSTLSLNRVIFSENIGGSNGSGGISNAYGNLTLNEVSFINNSSDATGAGMAIYYTTAHLMNVTFSGNKTLNRDAGGIFMSTSKVTIANSSFTNNYAGASAGGSSGGGAIRAGSGGTLTLINVSFSGNEHKSKLGVDIYYDGQNKKNELKVINCLFGGGAGRRITMSTGDEETQNEKITLAYTSYPENSVDTFLAGTPPNNKGRLEKQEISSFHDVVELSPLTNHGGFVETQKPLSQNAVSNRGIYVKHNRNEDIFYFSIDKINWYTEFDTTSSAEAGGFLLSSKTTPSSYAIDLTATDATGYLRKERPDLGALEYR